MFSIVLAVSQVNTEGTAPPEEDEELVEDVAIEELMEPLVEVVDDPAFELEADVDALVEDDVDRFVEDDDDE
ncbi:MAG: hypothetical protein ACYC7D_03445 [Nitrososphaerales archaeon]